MKNLYKIFVSMFLLCQILQHTINISLSIAQWEKTNGPFNGTVKCCAVSGQNFFAGTDKAGVFLSTNNGENWTAVNNGLSILNINILVISGNNIYAGSSGVFLSTNNGDSWRSIGLSNQYISSLAVSGNKIIASGEEVFLSTNNGDNWISTGLIESITSLAISGNNLIAANDALVIGGVYVSSNNGASWNYMAMQHTGSLASKENYVYAGNWAGGIYVSTNSGFNWTYSGLSNYYVNSVAVNGNNLIAGTYSGIFRSTNEGVSWFAAGLPNYNISSAAVSGNNVFAVTYNNASFLSTNSGENWTTVNIDSLNLSVLSLAINGQNLFAGTNYNGAFLSTNNGENWNAINSGLTSQSVTSFAIKENYLFAGTNQGIFSSISNGGNWTYSGLSDLFVNTIAVSGNNIFAGTNHGLFLSTNNGGNWTASGLLNRRVYSLSVSGISVFAGTDSGLFLGGTHIGLSFYDIMSLTINGNNVFAGTDSGGVFLSSNNGGNWIAAGLSNRSIHSLFANGIYLFSGTDSGVYMSANKGVSWLDKNQGFNSSADIRSIIMGNGFIFGGTYYQSVWRRLYSDIIITGIKQITGPVPSSFLLSQNYPNPFNPITNFEFGISDLGFTSLKVYDLLGKEVVILVNEKLNPGLYRVEFDAGNLTSGVYFYRLTAGDFTDTKRMMIVK